MRKYGKSVIHKGPDSIVSTKVSVWCTSVGNGPISSYKILIVKPILDKRKAQNALPS